MSSASIEHVPVEGTVIVRSRAKAAGVVLLGVSMFVASAIILPLYFLQVPIPVGEAGVRINTLGALAAGGGLLLGPFIALLMGLLMLTRERLVLGPDRFQTLQTWGSKTKVVTQIPYRNIARIELVTHDGVKSVGIELASTADRDTYDIGANMESEKRSTGWHHQILGGYALSTDEIYRQFALKLDEFNRHRQ